MDMKGAFIVKTVFRDQWWWQFFFPGGHFQNGCRILPIFKCFFDFNEIWFIRETWYPELIGDDKKNFPAAIFKMAANFFPIFLISLISMIKLGHFQHFANQKRFYLTYCNRGTPAQIFHCCIHVEMHLITFLPASPKAEAGLGVGSLRPSVRPSVRHKKLVIATPLKPLNLWSRNLVWRKNTICSYAYSKEFLILKFLWELHPFWS